MSNDLKIFNANFHSSEVRQSFESTTGLKVNDNMAEFIGFINCLLTSQLASMLEVLYKSLPSKI